LKNDVFAATVFRLNS